MHSRGGASRRAGAPVARAAAATVAATADGEMKGAAAGATVAAAADVGGLRRAQRGPRLGPAGAVGGYWRRPTAANCSMSIFSLVAAFAVRCRKSVAWLPSSVAMEDFTQCSAPGNRTAAWVEIALGSGMLRVRVPGLRD